MFCYSTVGKCFVIVGKCINLRENKCLLPSWSPTGFSFNPHFWPLIILREKRQRWVEESWLFIFLVTTIKLLYFYEGLFITYMAILKVWLRMWPWQPMPRFNVGQVKDNACGRTVEFYFLAIRGNIWTLNWISFKVFRFPEEMC